MINQYGQWIPDYPGQQWFQDPAYIRAYGANAPAMAQNAQQPQAQQQSGQMTPPTIRAEIIQAENLDAIDRYPQAAGTTQMYMTRDECYIVIRTALANGEHTDVIYDRRPPEPPAPKINPEEYVRKDEIAALIAETIQNMKGAGK